MNAETNIDYRLSALRDFIVIGILKFAIAVLVFAFSALITETVKAYMNQADNWMKDSSRAVSLKIRDLYR